MRNAPRRGLESGGLNVYEKITAYIRYFYNFGSVIIVILLCLLCFYSWRDGADTEKELDRAIEDNKRAGSAVDTARSQLDGARKDAQRASEITQRLIIEVKDSREIVDRLKANNSRARAIVEEALR